MISSMEFVDVIDTEGWNITFPSSKSSNLVAIATVQDVATILVVLLLTCSYYIILCYIILYYIILYDMI